MFLSEEDLRRVVWLSDPALSPDGKTAVYVRAPSDRRTGRNVPMLMEISLPDGRPVPVSGATKRQHSPRFSPDGAYLAFCSDDEKIDRLYIKDLSTMEERRLTSFGVTDYAWSPDGRRIAACVPLYRDRRGHPMTVETPEGYDAWKREMAHAPRFTEKLMYKLDEAFGFLDGTAGALYLIDPARGTAEKLAEGERPFALPSFSSDGNRLYYYARTGEREKSLQYELFSLELSNGESRRIDCLRPVSALMPVPEMDRFPVYAGFREETGCTEFFLIDREQGREIPLLRDGQTEGADPALIGDDRNGSMGPPVRTGSDGMLYYLTARSGRVILTDLNGRVCLSGGCIQGFSDIRGSTLVYLKSRPDHPGELFFADLQTGEEKCLTHENDWIDGYDTALPEKVCAEFKDHNVNGWALLPAGEGSCPAVLYIHGGPECFYGEDIFFYEAQSLRSRGFAVLWCNPRGSAGFGRGYLSGAYGQEAADDLMKFTDACIRRFPRIDPERLGVTGGSYGGYMTNKLTLMTDRFKACAAQRTWIDPATSYGTGDMGFMSGSGQTDFREYMLNRARGCMLRDIRSLNTPTLILHGDADVRCGEEQSDQLFNVIRALRPEIPCRMVVFPGENHSLTRTGLMHNRIRHMLEIRMWMERFLKEQESGK